MKHVIQISGRRTERKGKYQIYQSLKFAETDQGKKNWCSVT